MLRLLTLEWVLLLILPLLFPVVSRLLLYSLRPVLHQILRHRYLSDTVPMPVAQRLFLPSLGMPLLEILPERVREASLDALFLMVRATIDLVSLDAAWISV